MKFVTDWTFFVVQADDLVKPLLSSHGTDRIANVGIIILFQIKEKDKVIS